MTEREFVLHGDPNFVWVDAQVIFDKLAEDQQNGHTFHKMGGEDFKTNVVGKTGFIYTQIVNDEFEVYYGRRVEDDGALTITRNEPYETKDVVIAKVTLSHWWNIFTQWDGVRMTENQG